MPRKVNLPGPAELFRDVQPGNEIDDAARPAGEDAVDQSVAKATGRVRHDEKITVYVSREELLSLEAARLQLRAEHGIAIDRGRIVRAAISLALEDLSERGATSRLVTRVRES